MGMFNVLEFDGKCPKCNKVSHLEAEFKLGHLEMRNYTIGDKLKLTYGGHWSKSLNAEIEGYVECELCEKDFWVLIQIKHGAFVDPKILYNKEGFMS